MKYRGTGQCPKCGAGLDVALTGESYDCTCCDGLMWFVEPGEYCPVCGLEIFQLHQPGGRSVVDAEQKRRAAVERAGGRYNVIETNADARKLVGL